MEEGVRWQVKKKKKKNRRGEEIKNDRCDVRTERGKTEGRKERKKVRNERGVPK